MHLFYHPQITTNTFTLSEEESAHAIRVLRLKTGDTVRVTDGRGTEALCKIVHADTRTCTLHMVQQTLHAKTRPYSLHIALAPTKNRERIEWFVEKAVECGIDEVSFIYTENSERGKLNVERLHKISLSAMKQSKQWHLPVIHELKPYAEFMADEHKGTKLIAWCETEVNGHILRNCIPPHTTHITLLIGPEGDFTSKELTLATEAGFIPVSLGHSILRTETAALFGCMAVKTLLEN